MPLKSQMAQPGWEATWDREKSAARLLWVEAIRTVYAAALKLAGITALEHMHKLAGDAAQAAGDEEVEVS
jgi:arginyl-tRNA synthetase